jgi:NTE family protein
MHDRTVLVLQGGGALGAYQAGVYEGMAEEGIAPDWVTGVSIGAINGALIAGNPAETRLDRLRDFWDRVSSRIPGIAFAQWDPVRIEVNRLSAAAAAAFGVAGFFTPRMPPARDSRASVARQQSRWSRRPHLRAGHAEERLPYAHVRGPENG